MVNATRITRRVSIMDTLPERKGSNEAARRSTKDTKDPWRDNGVDDASKERSADEYGNLRTLKSRSHYSESKHQHTGTSDSAVEEAIEVDCQVNSPYHHRKER